MEETLFISRKDRPQPIRNGTEPVPYAFDLVSSLGAVGDFPSAVGGLPSVVVFKPTVQQ
jgi:hypothetical protein